MEMTKSFSAKKLAYAAMFTCIITVCSWITIPVGTIAFTLQTFAIALMAYTLGFGYSMLALSAYLLLGIAGVPVFSGFNSGAGAILGPTGGYIIGFFPMCALIALGRKVFGDKIWINLLVAAFSLAVLYVFGTFWFVAVYSKTASVTFAYAFTVCVLPFIGFDCVKIGLAIVIAKKLKNVIK